MSYLLCGWKHHSLKNWLLLKKKTKTKNFHETLVEAGHHAELLVLTFGRATACLKIRAQSCTNPMDRRAKDGRCLDFSTRHVPEGTTSHVLSSASLHLNEGTWRWLSTASPPNNAATSYVNICSAAVAHSQGGNGGSCRSRIQTLNKYVHPGCL